MPSLPTRRGLSCWLRRVEELHRLQGEHVRTGERLHDVDHARVQQEALHRRVHAVQLVHPLLAGVVRRPEALHVDLDLVLIQVHRVLLELGNVRIRN